MIRLTHKYYEEYFQAIQQAHNTLQGFYTIVISADPFEKIYLEEFLRAQKNIKLPCMVLQSYMGQYRDNGADNLYKTADGAFLILNKPASELPADRKEVQHQCETIAEDIIGYVRYDMRLPENLKTRWIDLNSFMHEQIGPVNNLFGTRIDFQLNRVTNAFLKYDPTKFTW